MTNDQLEAVNNVVQRIVAELDMTPTGKFNIPMWDYELHLKAACLEADPPLSRLFRDHIAKILDKYSATLAILVKAVEKETEQ